jgi:hypothetical protein
MGVVRTIASKLGDVRDSESPSQHMVKGLAAWMTVLPAKALSLPQPWLGSTLARRRRHR